MKRHFNCGHIGLGKFCHRCANDARPRALAQASEKEGEARRAQATTTAQTNDAFRRPRAAAAGRQAKEKAKARRAVLANAASHATLDLTAARHLPAVLKRALDVLAQLETGTHPLSLDGRVLTIRGGDFSVPVGRRHRILVDASSMKPLRFMTHATYNGLV
jgi:hypothetical protein